MRAGYKRLVDDVVQFGKRTSPRGEATRELLGVTIELADPTDALPIGTGRGLVSRIAAIEACQLIAGVGVAPLVTAASKNFEKSMEPDGTFWGNYGQRIGTQLEQVYDKIVKDPSTRQAVITLWDPTLDNQPNKRDYPCTVMFQFVLRDNELVMMTTMRSNDVWLGVPYDFFQFTQLQLTLATMLDVEAAWYMHRVGSLHIYESNLEVAEGLVSNDAEPDEDRPLGFGTRNDGPLQVRAKSIRVLANDPPSADETYSERWYRKHISQLHEA